MPCHAAIRAGIDTSLNRLVLAYATQQIGHQVGSGECTELAELALQRYGAKGPDAFGNVTPEGDYVWGTPVPLHQAQPGDIVQFRDFRVKTTIVSTTQENWSVDERDHHTAIVQANLGNALVILEQNVAPTGVVQRTRIPLTSQRFHGMPDGVANPFVTTTIEVEGTVRAYRPQRI